MIVIWNVIQDERIDVVKADFFNLIDFLNHNYYMLIHLQSKRKVNHWDEFDFGRLYYNE